VNDPAIAHCVEKIGELVRSEAPGRRELLQLGYNLGRLSELTGLGREPFWDRWKAAVADWDRPRLAALAREMWARMESGENLEKRAPVGDSQLGSDLP
jgi:hypothetical protein